MPEPAVQSQKFSDEGPVAASPVAALEQSIDELLQNIAEAASEVSASIQTHAPKPATFETPPAEPTMDLESSIDTVIEEAKRRDPAPEEPPAAEVPVQVNDPVQAVKEVDQTLAKRADEAMKETPPSPAEPPPAAAPAPAPAEPVSMTETAEVDSPAATEVEEPAQDDLVAILAAPAPVAVVPVERSGLRWSLGLGRIGTILAWPLSFLPQEVRDVVGWFGLVTLFNAACIWIYVLTH